ncbi:hypothetical protein PV08_11281 [Exophiala spinifera]|uniref:C2H2-type domain-containing protein n=1 Tax=Exophiala spinifera TaxID=91928 RepID=A0A0D2BG21_9EURO|nr:uncharacterized protein PV08_11281 [Exophiala spinifera]KIW10319.1 hypothetical protein PV08_11281 [Exophiala spinifera]
MDHALEDAIQSATEARVKSVLLKICQESSACRDAVSKELLLVTATTAGTQDEKSKKRVRQAYETCAHCEEEYRVVENDLLDGLCQYHPGSRDCDWDHDKFADFEPWRDGDPEDFEDDPDFADAFKWDCCGGNGAADGCVVTKHQPDETKRIKLGRV